MNFKHIANALGYHGQPLQKIWDDERGVEELRLMDPTQQPNFSVYQERSKFFTFQERAKRLKMHQFLARKAADLYDSELQVHLPVAGVVKQGVCLGTWARECLVQQPPYEFFLQLRGDKRKAWVHRMETLKQGDIIYASVVKMVMGNRLMVKTLCTDEPLCHYLADIPIKAVISQQLWGPLPIDTEGKPRYYTTGDLIRCEICNISADVDRLTLSLVSVFNKSPDVKLGLCELSELPNYYRQIKSLDHPSVVHYEDHLNAALEFQNPNYDLLFQLNGIEPHENLTMMSYIKAGFPKVEYASELRQKQASQWAFRSVADGIEHFKNGQQTEAFQCLNKALNIDPRNVEGLVARGALYANRGSFLKGLQDFEKALMLNKYHVNARKYMGETLVALGRSYEEENRLPEAIKAYSDCLNLLPQHEQARQSLDALQRLPPGVKPILSSELLNLPNTPRGSSNKNARSTEESSSSSDDSDHNEEQAEKPPPAPRLHFGQPFYAIDEGKSSAVIDAHKANEFKLDDDDGTMTSVRKLLREATKHKKSKKKSKKKKDKKEKKSKSKSNERELDPMELLKKIDFSEAFRLMNQASSEAQLKSQLQNYFQPRRGRGEDSPPPAPSMRKHSIDLMGPSTSKAAKAAALAREEAPPAPKFHEQKQQPKLSFQIKKRSVQMDKFGMLCLATPLEKRKTSSSSHSRSRSPSPRKRATERRRRSSSRSRSRSHSRSRSRRHISHSRSRSRSPPTRHGGSRFKRGSFSHYRRQQRHSRSRSRSRSFDRRGSPSPSYHSRRSPSPFVPRRTPSPSERYRRTRSPSRSRSRSRSYSPRRHHTSSFRFIPRGRGRGRGRSRFHWVNRDTRQVSRAVEPPAPNGRKSEDRRRSSSKSCSPRPKVPAKDDVGPTIEEVDEMIKEAQKERKQGIIESDKNILKKAADTTTQSPTPDAGDK